jgi:hypothetical protein
VRRRAREHLETGVAHGPLHDQLALQARRPLRTERLRPAALGHDLEQPPEAHHPGAEHGAPLRQLPLRVLDVAERGHHEHRLARERVAVGAEHDPGLARVGGTCDELERHGDPI